MIIVHSPRCLEYAAPGHPESPERVRRAAELLRAANHEWLTPEPCGEEELLRAHGPGLLAAVRSGNYYDADTPWFPQIHELARLSAGAATRAARSAWERGPAFSLMRPPGHHAERDRIMGFCYFNNIAVAVAGMLDAPNPAAEPRPRRIAIFDFDCHHGNGTEEIFFGDERVLFVSVHQSPCYPGSGLVARGNCLNLPLPPGTPPERFMSAVDEALDAIGRFAPEMLAVSAGFDAYAGDPITQMNLEIDSFGEIGGRIGAFCRQAAGRRSLPCFAVLEGGYSADFARCVGAFVTGWETGARRHEP
jgi:acetoin utilization deacetylase AcuC-like enzyme